MIFDVRLLRTLQRRVREWRALHGPAVTVCFLQDHPPGQTLIADFTAADALAVTLGGGAFAHRLLHARLSCSGWQFARVVLGGESFSALAEGSIWRWRRWAGFRRNCAPTACRQRIAT